MNKSLQQSPSRSSSISSAVRTSASPLLKRTGLIVIFTLLVIAFASGCSRTVLVPEGSPIRIGPDCRTKVYSMQDDEWVLSENKVHLPEGWYCVPPSFVRE